MKKHTILFLAANPLGTDRLALDEEARAIQVELERGDYRDEFELVTRWASRPLDLLRELRKLKPTVVQFSGHGCCSKTRGHRLGDAPHRNVADEHGCSDGGLFFQGSDGFQLVSTRALAETFAAAGASVRLVVLNAGYCDKQAEALLAHVDCIVGLNGSLSDDAARNFAIGFYGGLGERESVAAAYQQGCAAISLEGLLDGERPWLKVRDGIDARQLFLSEVRLECATALNVQPERDLVVTIMRMALRALTDLKGLPIEASKKKDKSQKSEIANPLQ